LKNLLYFHLDFHDVKPAQHVRYDEGMNDVAADPLPSARLVRFAQHFPAEAELLEPLDPFRDLRT
jgi:hypothetical protein